VKGCNMGWMSRVKMNWESSGRGELFDVELSELMKCLW